MVTADRDASTFDEAERIGRSVGDAVCELLDDVELTSETTIRIVSRELEIPLTNERLRLAFEAGVVNRGTETSDVVTTDLCAFAIGPAQFVTCPGEALPMVGLSAKGMMPGSPTFFLGITQDELGYILPPEYFGLELYGYECSMSIGPDAAPAVLSALAELLPQVPPED